MNKRFFNQQNLTRRLRLLPVLFAMLLMPLSAWAQTITVAGVSPDAYGNFEGISGVHYEAVVIPDVSTSYTLTLNGATINGQISSDIAALKVHLVGENTITPEDGKEPFVYNNAANTGTLTFESSNSEAGELLMSGISEMGSIGSGYTVTNEFTLYGENGSRWIKEAYSDMINIYYNVYYGITVNGTSVSKYNKNAVMELSGTDVSYTPADNTLHVPDNPAVSDYEIQSHLSALNVSIYGDCALKSICFAQNDDFPATSGTLTIMQDETNAGGLNKLTLSDANGVIRGFTSVTIEDPLVLRSPASTAALATASSAVISNYATAYNITVAGVQVTDANKGNVLNDAGTPTVVFTPADNTVSPATPATLTLNGASINGKVRTNYANLTIELIGKNTIEVNDTSALATWYAGTNLVFTTSETSPGSLTMKPGADFLAIDTYRGFNITYENGLSLNPATPDAGETAVVGVSYGLTVGGVPVTNANASDILADIEYLNGKVSFTVEDDKNLLILDGTDGANLVEYDIVSDLTNLTILFKGNCSLNTITSNKTNATLRFEKAEDAGDGTQLTGSLLGGSLWSGFGGGVTFGGSLAYLPNSDTWYIYNLPSPNISVENNAVSFSYNNITNVNDFNFFYTLQYEDENQQSVTTFTQYDPQNPLTINKASVLTVKARYKYAEDYSDVSIGKYFGFASNTVETTYSEEVTLPTIIPTLPEGITLFYNVHEDGNTAGVTSDDETGTITGYSNVGEATVNVELRYEESPDFIILNEMDGDFETLGDFTLTVVPKSLTNDMIQAIADQTYAGTALTPAIVVKDGETTLTQAENAEAEGDFTVAFSNNTNAALSTAETAPTVTITGKGNYTGTATKTFTIAAKDLASATVTVDPNQTYTYTGSAITPNVSSVSIKLTEGADAATNLTSDDYTVTGYANNTDAALATAETNAPTVTITGKGNFTGTATGTFTIAQAKLSAVTIAAIGNQTFTGSQITPGVTVTFNEKTVSTDEYNVVYGDNINAGENAGTVTLTSKNKNFVTSTDEDATTKKTVTFNIVAATAAITATDQTVTFNGGAQEFTNYTIANGEAAVTYYSSEEARAAQSGGTTSAPTNADTYYVQVTQVNNNYTSDPADATFTISPMTLTSEMVTLSATSFVYSGAAQTPDVTVADGDNILTINTNYDYVIKQGETVVASPMNVGSYSVVVTGKGNYSGTVTQTFTIAAKELASATVTVDPTQTYTYTGSAITPNVSSVSIKLTEGAEAATNLTAETDYTVTGYANNTDAALATAETNAPTVTITGKGNFTGTATGTFTIAQAKLSAVTIAAIGNQTYTGSQITPEVTVTFNGNNVSTNDYNVVYGDNINAGENAGTVTLTSKNKNFVTSTDEDATTKKTATFNIVAAAAAITATDQTVTFDGEEQPFTNYTIANGTPRVTYYSSEEARTAQSGGTTSAPTEAAIYYVQVTQGDANYTSNPANATFTISPKALTEGMVEQDGVSFTYSGYTPEYSVSVKDGEEYLAGDDYDCVIKQGGTEIIPVNAGSYDVVVTGKRNYTGTITKTLTITKAQLTVTPDDKTYNVGDDITLTVKITGFVEGEDEGNLTTQPTASYGTADVTKPGSYEITASGGEAQNYDFVYKTGTLTINRVLDVSFSDNNDWVTYYGTENLATPEGLQAYIVTAVGTSAVTTSAIDYIPANTAVLLKDVEGKAASANIVASAYEGETTTFPDNILQGGVAVDVSTITGGTVYVLYKDMFKRATGGTIPANRGYLVVEPSAVNAGNAPQLSITIGDDTTGIGTVGCDSVATDNDEWYTLDGQKLQQAPTQKGLYIKNGKKVVINKK